MSYVYPLMLQLCSHLDLMASVLIQYNNLFHYLLYRQNVERKYPG